MRIISGEWRSRPITAPKGDVTRPTADRTRETLFSMLNSRLGNFKDLYVLDLFSGSGALGLEALSRGAAHVTFVEQDPAALNALRKNIANLGAEMRCDVRPISVMTLGPAQRGYDIILADPPYDTKAGSVAIDKLTRLGWVAPDAWISLETAHKEEINIKAYDIETQRKVGKAKLTLLRAHMPTCEE